jgi:hypothetical protein
MTLYEFNALSEDEKAYITWNGAFIGERIKNNFKIALYSIDGFYVEAYYDVATNEVNKFRSFSSTEQLQPYLVKINIDHLFK